MTELEATLIIGVAIAVFGWVITICNLSKTSHLLSETDNKIDILEKRNAELEDKITLSAKTVEDVTNSYIALSNYNKELMDVVKKSTSIKAAKSGIADIWTKYSHIEEDQP